MSKPRVSDVSKWNYRTWAHQADDGALTEVAVGEADNHSTFYKVIISRSHFDFFGTNHTNISKPKYFYGEMAWADVNRYVSDETHWTFFSLDNGGSYV